MGSELQEKERGERQFAAAGQAEALGALKTLSSKEKWLGQLKGYKSIESRPFLIKRKEGNSDSNSETTLTLVDISLSEDSDYSDRTDLIPIEPGKKYIATIEAAGIVGKPYGAYFGVSLFGSNNEFIGRRVAWLDDFTGELKKYDVIFNAPGKASKARIIYRINLETPRRSFCEYKLLPLKEAKLLSANPSLEERYDTPSKVVLDKKTSTAKQKEAERVAIPDKRPEAIGLVRAEIEAAKAAQKLVFPKISSPKVSIIILNYDRAEYTFNCLSSILRNTEPEKYEVILVENGSTEEESKNILSKLENVKILEQRENLGFIKGNNYASKQANGDYLLFLNNDTIVLKGWLSSLLSTFERHDKVGIVGSKLIYPDGTLQEAGSMVWKDGSARGYGRNADDPSKPEYQFVREVDYCSGASLLIKKSLFDEIGGFNEYYAPAYFEDVDLSFAARRKGYKTLYNPFSVVVHYEGVTSTRDVHNPNGVKRFELENRPKFVSLWKEQLDTRLPALDENVIFARDLKKGPAVLVVDGWVPEPDKSSGDIRSYNITRIFSQLGCKVTLYVSDFRESKYAKDLREMGIEVVSSSYVALDQLLRQRSGYYSLAIVNANRLSLANSRSYFSKIRSTSSLTKVAFHIDDLYGYGKIIKKSLTKDDFNLSEDDEVMQLINEHSKDMLELAEFVFVISKKEELLVNNLLKTKKCVVIPEMRELIPKKEVTSFKQRANAIIYVGGFSHQPNLASASLLIHTIFPKVKAQVPDAKLYVVGNVPPAEFLNLKDESIVVTGFVEDLSQYYNIAKVSACPIVAKGGVKGKIIEALNYGTPVVTSPLGTEGTELVDGQNILVAKNSDEAAEKIIKLFKAKTLWDNISKNGRSYFEHHNSTLLSETILSEFLQQTYSRSNPEAFPSKSLYQRWYESQYTEENLSNMRAELSAFKLKPKISIIMPVYKTPSNLLISAIGSVTNQLYENWQLCICDDGSKDLKLKNLLTTFVKDPRIQVVFSKRNEGIAGASNHALGLAKGEYIALLDHDDELSPNALFEVVKMINNNPEVDYIYSDEDKINEKGEHSEPFFKPDWSPDLFLSVNYLNHLSIIRKSLVDGMKGFRKGLDGSQDYDLLLRVTEKTDRITHIQKILYNWRKIAGSGATAKDAKPYAYDAGKRALQDAIKRREIAGTVVDGYIGFYRVKYDLIKHPLVSIMILNKNNAEMLRRCIESVLSKTTYDNYEIIIVDHSSTDQETLEYLDSLRATHTILNYEGPFNFSRMNNLAAKSARGDHFIFLNNDTEVIEPSWIEAMLEHSQREEIGAVGVKLFYPDNSIQHAGIIVGFADAATNYEINKNDSGYFGFENVIRDCSGVTAACIMVRRDVFESIGGYDEDMARSWQDVDLCLRIRDTGRRIVYTPYASLYHITGGTRGRIDLSPEEITAKDYFRRKHRQSIENGDPYYNHNLSLLGGAYMIADFMFITDPMDMLLSLYDFRPDLQKAFPEVRSGKYGQLLSWAVEHGTKTDDSRIYLAKFTKYYEDKAASDPMNLLLSIYDSRPDLQAAYPEARSGEYEGLLRWAAEYGIRNDGASVHLSKFTRFFEEHANIQSK